MGKKRPKWVQTNVSADLADSKMFVFQVVFPNKLTETIDLFSDLDIDYDHLEGHLEEVPAQYMFWAAAYSELKSRVTVLETKLGVRRAVLTKETLEQFKSRGIKLTDKQLTLLLDKDAKLNRIEMELALAQKNAGKVYHMVEAIRMRSEHCRSLAGFKRQDKEQSSHQT